MQAKRPSDNNKNKKHYMWFSLSFGSQNKTKQNKNNHGDNQIFPARVEGCARFREESEGTKTLKHTDEGTNGSNSVMRGLPIKIGTPTL
jgi:hypothetical protein